MFEIIGYIATAIITTIFVAHMITKIINITKTDKYEYLNINHYCGINEVSTWTLIPTIELDWGGHILSLNFIFLRFYFYISYEFVTDEKDKYLAGARVSYYRNHKDNETDGV